MGQLFAWSLVSSLTLLAMYIVYKWLLAAENQHAFNRVALLAIYMAAIFAPFMLHISFRPHPAGKIEMDGIMVDFAEVAAPVAPDPSLLPVIALWIYIAGIIVVMLSTVVVFARLIQLVSSGERRQLSGGYILVLTDHSKVAPFSWRKYIVMSHSDWEEAGGIIARHEMRHISACHWLDLLLAQAVVALQWYNPAAWLMREELKTVHEYQADEAVITSGSDINEYQMLLIKKAVGARFPSLANSLNHSKLKKRITMMYKNRSSAGRRMRSLALVPAFAVALLVACTPGAKSVIDDASETTLDVSDSKGSEKTLDNITINSSAEKLEVTAGSSDSTAIYINGKRRDAAALAKLESSAIKSVNVVKPENAIYVETKNSATVLDSAEEMPEFPGGMEALMTYLSSHIQYPAKAAEAKNQGRVVVKFVIGEDGKVRDPEIAKGVSEELDAEAIRVVKSLPDFIPGKVDGKPVAVSYHLPINFKLQ